MVFDWTEEQLMLRDMIRKFTKNEVAPRDKWMDENGYDWDLHKNGGCRDLLHSDSSRIRRRWV